jgi:hypothetical protein
VGDLTTKDNSSLILSYNLAIGGATIDNNIVSAPYEDMASQVASFQSVYSKKPHIAPWRSDNAIFGFWIGINEYDHHSSSWDPSDDCLLVSAGPMQPTMPASSFPNLWTDMSHLWRKSMPMVGVDSCSSMCHQLAGVHLFWQKVHRRQRHMRRGLPFIMTDFPQWWRVSNESIVM